MSEQKYGELTADLSGAYALNALTEAERAAVERQLLHDETLWTEVTEFGDTAALLGLAVEPVEPPAGLRSRLMAQIEQVQQHREAADETPVEATPVTSVAPAKSRRLWIMRPLIAFGAAAVVIIGGYGVGSSITASPTQPVGVVQALQQDPNHETAHVNTARGAVTVIWSDTEHQAAMKLGTSALNLPGNNVYQLWVTNAAGKTQSAGILSAGDHTWQEFTQHISKGSVLRMTVEPAGGSKQPTTDPLFAVTV